MARERQVQARCEGEWELTNEMMITQKSLCDSIPVGGALRSGWQRVEIMAPGGWDHRWNMRRRLDDLLWPLQPLHRFSASTSVGSGLLLDL